MFDSNHTIPFDGTSDTLAVVTPAAAPQGGRSLEGMPPAAGDLWNQAQALLGVIFRACRDDGRPLRTVGLTSCYRGEGVSTTVAGLALPAATHRKLLLVDANLRHPALHRQLRVAEAPGLAQIIDGQAERTATVQQSPVAPVSVIAAGKLDGEVPSCLPANRVLPVLNEAAQDCDLVIVDLPALADNAAALELAAALDAVVLVVEAERVRWQAGRRTVNLLRQSGTRLLGAVLNKRRDHIPDWLYQIL